MVGFWLTKELREAFLRRMKSRILVSWSFSCWRRVARKSERLKSSSFGSFSLFSAERLEIRITVYEEKIKKEERKEERQGKREEGGRRREEGRKK